ncbi:YkgJ family cysteine cluster protein [bacterium]|nr:YkgJ family cysteine cluster protein [bacterium]
MDYINFLKGFDKKLEEYNKEYSQYINCSLGCSFCCEKGEYHLSELELNYLMKGFLTLSDEVKQIVHSNFIIMKKGEACPFLVNKKCSVYEYRPIVCRVHGLAYLTNNIVKVPYCANIGKNYAEVYRNNEFFINPVSENLDTPNVLKDFDYGDIRSLYDWLKI